MDKSQAGRAHGQQQLDDNEKEQGVEPNLEQVREKPAKCVSEPVHEGSWSWNGGRLGVVLGAAPAGNEGCASDSLDHLLRESG